MKIASFTILLVINLFAFASIHSCLKVSSPSKSRSAEKSVSTISGAVQAGRIFGATVTAYVLDETGNRGKILGTAQTDSFGKFSIKLSSIDGPVECVVTGGQYVDESTQLTVTLQEGEELTLVSNDLVADAAASVRLIVELSN